MSNYTHNHNSKQCTIFDEFNSIADVSNTLIITTLEDCRGDRCTYATDPTVINNALSDFSGDASVKMNISEGHEGLTLTLSNNTAHALSTSRIHSNRIGHCERDPESGLLWYSRGEL